MSDPKIAVGYLRTSTDEQHLGPEAQRAAIERWAAKEGVSVVSWHFDQVSGGAPLEKRTALLAALDAVKTAGAGLLVVAKRDRLARDVMIAAMVERLAERDGARVVSADGAGNEEGPEGQLMRGIMDLFAQYERAIIRARVRAALGVKKRRGERVGTIPYGWRLVAGSTSQLVEDEGEQAIIEKIRAYREEGRTLRKIVELLNDSRTPARGRRWHLKSVARIAKVPDR